MADLADSAVGSPEVAFEPSEETTAAVDPAAGMPHEPLRTIARVVRGTRLCLLAGALVAVPTSARSQLPPSGNSGLPVTEPSVAEKDLDKPFAAFSRSALTLRDSVVALARAQIGTPYVLGGESPKRGFDCSGLVKYVLAALSISLPRTAAQQGTLGAPLPKDTTRLRPGDLLTFGRGSRVTHIGIYVGGGRYVHASTTARRVIETSLARTRSPLTRVWRGGRDVIALAGEDRP